MSGPSSVLTAIETLLAKHGLSPRGVVRFGSDEPTPRLPDGGRSEAVVLIGVAGAGMWPVFSVWQAAQPDRGGTDPLDRWSKSIIDAVAREVGAAACYPSEAPYQPFQGWATRAEGLRASPLGILIHPRFGLWHSYRGALLFGDWPEGGKAAVGSDHPCDRCRNKPCLSACPVGAITEDGFGVLGCRRHLATPEGQRSCMVSGCLARNACPVGTEYRYPEAQLRFHMQALTLPD